MQLKARIQSDIQAERVLSEAQALNEVQHPFIVCMLGAFQVLRISLSLGLSLGPSLGPSLSLSLSLSLSPSLSLSLTRWVRTCCPSRRSTAARSYPYPCGSHLRGR